MPYTLSAGNAPADDWLTMRPPPRSVMLGTTARAQFHAPVTFTANARSQSSRENCIAG